MMVIDRNTKQIVPSIIKIDSGVLLQYLQFHQENV